MGLVIRGGVGNQKIMFMLDEDFLDRRVSQGRGTFFWNEQKTSLKGSAILVRENFYDNSPKTLMELSKR